MSRNEHTLIEGDAEADIRLEKLLGSMLFHRLHTKALPSAAALWPEIVRSAAARQALQDEFGTSLEEDWADVAKQQFLIEASVAYDTMWFITAAITRCAAQGVVPLDTGTALNGG